MSESGFGDWIADYMARRRMSQKEFAELVGFDASAVSRWVGGGRAPEPPTVARIAEKTGVSVDFLLTLAGHRPRVEGDGPEAAALIAMIRNIDWTPERFDAVQALLRALQAHSGGVGGT